jgi:hypothetical protein
MLRPSRDPLQDRSSIASLIPLLYAQLDSAQAAVDQATDFLIENVIGFEEAVQCLLTSHGATNIDGNQELHDFVTGCRFYCTGNLAWR